LAQTGSAVNKDSHKDVEVYLWGNYLPITQRHAVDSSTTTVFKTRCSFGD